MTLLKVLFGCFVWNINPCWLFSTKSCLYIYIKYIWFGLVEFYGMSTIVGYFMPNPVQARRLYWVLINKKKRACLLVDFSIPVDHREKMKESKTIDKYLDFARELNKAMEHSNDGGTNCSWCAWNGLQRLCKGAGVSEDQKRNRDHPGHSTFEISKNT